MYDIELLFAQGITYGEPRVQPSNIFFLLGQNNCIPVKPNKTKKKLENSKHDLTIFPRYLKGLATIFCENWMFLQLLLTKLQKIQNKETIIVIRELQQKSKKKMTSSLH